MPKVSGNNAHHSISTYISFDGILRPDNKAALHAFVQNYSALHQWEANCPTAGETTFVLDKASDPLWLVLDEDARLTLRYDTTGMPVAAHKEIVKFAVELVSFCREAHLDDNTGYWERRVLLKQYPPTRLLDAFPTFSSEALSGQTTLALCEHATQEDRTFWEQDIDHVDPYYRGLILLHLATVRNYIGWELSDGSGKTVCADELVRMYEEEGLFCYPPDFYREHADSHYFRALAKMWAWKRSAGKPTKARQQRCDDFAESLYHGVYGCINEFSSKNNREAVTSLVHLLEQEGPASSYRSIQILHALFAFCGLKTG